MAHSIPFLQVQGLVRRSSGLKRMDLWRDLLEMQKAEICLVLAETEKNFFFF